ncbi:MULTISPECIES: heme-binding protein [unclassified Sphingomonas]|uniref:heme-binding protein n=1 Tax=unclassified Sphingomonas TaxID=196159 RepID=UPI00226A878F|nr:MULTISPECIES: heme-binding protein [unclassified Sphingomonas]
MIRAIRMVQLALAGAALLLTSCGGGGTPETTSAAIATDVAASAPTTLTTADVGRIIAQAAGEARARGLPSVIAVTDRVGNVLGVFEMTGARTTATIPLPANGVGLDAQGVAFPAALGAISKALTGAYLSSGGNAFTTRTASEIVQERFPPAPSTLGLESGPLFGVQFSQLPCSDLMARYDASGSAGATIGPKRAPLGLAADAGGMPLYKNGVLVGGIGVMGDGVYGFDPNILDVDDDPEEAIAVAGVTGFEAPPAITADKITIDGTSLRYSDATAATLKSVPGAAAGFDAINGSAGRLLPVRGYFADTGTPALTAGQPFGNEASGIRPATAAEFSDATAYVLSDGRGNNRYPIIAATDGGEIAQPLTAAEVRATLEEAFTIMGRARGQIRRPLNSAAQVSITVVDTRGVSLGFVLGADAPLFGIDVALQKARTAAFLSSGRAASVLLADPSSDVRGFVGATRGFLSDPAALGGATAFTARAIGNLSRPYFPDGQIGTANGPLSRPIAQFSPFSTGLQSALIIGNLAQHIGYVTNETPDTPRRCTGQPLTAAGQARVANGIQIFPGSVPIYRGATLVGAIGVSGDGIDQDDMIAFLGLYNAGQRASGIGEAPSTIRSDRIVAGGPDGVRLRFVGCPFAPFLDSSVQDACSGK